MGFDLKDSGFHIMLAKTSPEMIGAKIADWCPVSWSETGRKREEIKGGSCIPAEARLLQVETGVGLDEV